MASSRVLISLVSAAAFAVAAAPAAACGGFPSTLSPGLGTSSTTNRSLNAGDIVTVTYSSPGAPAFRVFKSNPAPTEDIVPLTTGPVNGVATYTAPVTAANYTFSASRNGGDGQFASVTLTCAAPVPVPTMTEWSMILFGTVLAGSAVLFFERRRFMA